MTRGARSCAGRAALSGDRHHGATARGARQCAGRAVLGGDRHHGAVARGARLCAGRAGWPAVCPPRTAPEPTPASEEPGPPRRSTAEAAPPADLWRWPSAGAYLPGPSTSPSPGPVPARRRVRSRWPGTRRRRERCRARRGDCPPTDPTRARACSSGNGPRSLVATQDSHARANASLTFSPHLVSPHLASLRSLRFARSASLGCAVLPRWRLRAPGRLGSAAAVRPAGGA